jgi:hypothetical protein
VFLNEDLSDSVMEVRIIYEKLTILTILAIQGPIFENFGTGIPTGY